MTMMVLHGCIEPYILEEENAEQLLVVDGLISNQNQHHQVRLTYTAPFGLNQDFSPLVFGAQVSLKDQEGNNLSFEPSGPGTYRLTEPYAANPGQCYQLQIQLQDGSNYISGWECMPSPVPIDSAFYEVREVIRYDPANNAYRSIEFPISIISKDPAEVRNYYFWNWTAAEEMLTQPAGIPIPEDFVSRCWLNSSLKRNNRVIINSDQFVNGNLFSQEIYALPYDRSSQFLITVDQYSISAEAYRHLQQIKQESKRSGSLFEPAPGRVTGNIICTSDQGKQALGYFRVAGHSSIQLLVKRSVPGKIPEKTRPKGDCLEIYERATLDKPEGFD